MINSRVKVIVNYLPQFHHIPENDSWWGKGYTDWNAVKKASPLFKGHIEPRKPLNNHYYDLSNISEIKWQSKLARKYGIYGFGIYHYWFSSDLHLLDKPVKLLRNNKDISINYFLIWDNASWKRTWDNVKFANDWAPLFETNTQSKNGILAKLVYGNKIDWKIHFNYLLNFFNDERYIKVNNCPVFAFYNQDNKPLILKKMIKYWNELAINAGFNGIYEIGKVNNQNINITDHHFLYNPEWDGWLWHNQIERIKNKIDFEKSRIFKHPIFYKYDNIWKKIINDALRTNKNTFLSGFVAYDDTPRRGKKGRVVLGATPSKFEDYFDELYKISLKQNKKFVFLTAWNEWGEGAYLEPDQINKYDYLQAIKNVVEKYARYKK